MKREGEWQRRGAPVHLGSLPLFSLPRAKGSPPTHHTRGEKDIMKERQTSREERKKEKEETARKGEKEKNPKITPKTEQKTPVPPAHRKRSPCLGKVLFLSPVLSRVWLCTGFQGKYISYHGLCSQSFVPLSSFPSDSELGFRPPTGLSRPWTCPSRPWT